MSRSTTAVVAVLGIAVNATVGCWAIATSPSLPVGLAAIGTSTTLALAAIAAHVRRMLL